jgi:hypothetical protein
MIMSFKLSMTAAIVLSFSAAAGCAVPPPTTLNINTNSGSGGDGSGGSGGDGSTGTGDPVGVGGSSSTGMMGSAAKAYFIATVYPELQQTCAGCHATGQNGAPLWMGMNANATYNAMDMHGGLIVAPDNSLILLHGAHTGPALSGQEQTDVTTWLTMEATERGLMTTSGSTGTGMMMAPPETLATALKEYGGCMDYTDWTDNKLDTLCDAQTLNNGPCKSCHTAGDGGNWLSGNAQETFDMNKKFPYIKREVTGTVDDVGNFKDLIAANRWIDKGSEPCQPNTNCHPQYVLTPELKTGINNFVSKTIDKWHNKMCP